MKRLVLLLLIFQVMGRLFAQDTVRAGSNIREYIAPTLMISYGIWCAGDQGFPSSKTVRNYRNDVWPTVHTTIDDYLVFAPAAAVYTLDWIGIPAANNPINQTLLLAKTSAITLTAVYALKYLTREHRPNGSNEYSFPSSHTAVAFAYATALHQEFKDHNRWISAAGYTAATAVGALRIANDAHWFNDVLVGAGIGILGTKLVYLTHRHRFTSNWPKKSALLPNIGNHFYGMVWLYTF